MIKKTLLGISAALQGILLVLVAVLTLTIGSILMYSRMMDMVQEDAYRRAQNNIDRVEFGVDKVAGLVSCAVRNNMWSAQRLVSRPDSLWKLAKGIVQDNPIIYGSAIALVENYNPRRSGRFFSPYAHRDGDSVKTVQLGTKEYDYVNKEWFQKGLAAGENGVWSEPYYDEGGGNTIMTTLSVPVRDHRGRLAAVLTSDVALDWVSDLLGALVDYPDALKMLVSQSGTVMATSPYHPEMDRRNIIDLAQEMDDAAEFEDVNRAMLAGEEGYRLVHIAGKKYYVFYDRLQQTGWSMSICIPDEEIFSGVRTLNRQVTGIHLLGILMLIVILIVTVLNQQKLVQVKEKEGRIDSELRVASDIQMAMLPKVFPPFPERKDVDIFASLIPAKAVGGDLYDYFIREERLYFCIGDVSGKGVPASLVMSVTRSLFRTVAGHEKSPQRIVTTMNRNLVEMNVNDMFVTLFCGVLDLKTGHLRYCNAGHNAPYVLGAGGSQALPVIPNLPLGIMDAMFFSEQETDLLPGDGIFLYTDGLNEAENTELELFGMDRVEALLDASLPATELVHVLEQGVKSFVGEAPQSDDLTLLSIRFLNQNPDKAVERHLILHNEISEISALEGFMDSVASLAGLDKVLTNSLNLALEEAVTNVILYAYPEGTEGLVDIETVIREDQVCFVVMDSGKAFDPTVAPEADVTLSAEDRPIGGLGIFLVRQIMDSVSYERLDGRNVLTMKKNLL